MNLCMRIHKEMWLKEVLRIWDLMSSKRKGTKGTWELRKGRRKSTYRKNKWLFWKNKWTLRTIDWRYDSFMTISGFVAEWVVPRERIYDSVEHNLLLTHTLKEGLFVCFFTTWNCNMQLKQFCSSPSFFLWSLFPNHLLVSVSLFAPAYHLLSSLSFN